MTNKSHNILTLTRRRLIGAAAASLAMPALARAQGAGHVVVIGGSFGGATAARALHRLGHQVTLVERETRLYTCPFSNAVLGGFGRLAELAQNLDVLAAEGIRVVTAAAEGVDGAAKTVTLSTGDVLTYDRLVLAPGIKVMIDAMPGYADGGEEAMPHAWKAGPQTEALAAQIAAMPQGGRVAIVAPAAPYRCPPGPYERASLIAHYLSQHNPTAKILILDAKESFSKMPLFQQAWERLYPGMIEWRPPSMGGNVVAVSPATMTIETDFMSETVDVANVIPPQQAAEIAHIAGVADGSGWCPVNALTFESDIVPFIHVIGDAAFAGTMPKSAFTANMNGKVVARAIDALLRGASPLEDVLVNTCYSLAAPDYGFTVAGVYRAVDGKLAEVAGAGGISDPEGPVDDRVAEADYARAWYHTITQEVWGGA